MKLSVHSESKVRKLLTDKDGSVKNIMVLQIEETGFLTIFNDIKGLGDWNRRWCKLKGNLSTMLLMKSA